MKRSKLIVKIIVFAFLIYAGISLITMRGRIEARQQELNDMRRRVAELELSNAELEYEIEHFNDPDVIASIARSNLGLVLPGEIVFYDGGSGQANTD
jgi:cell division protein FtsL